MSYTSWIEAVKSVGLGEKREAGDVWQTDAGTWAGWRRGEKQAQYDLDDEGSAKAYVAGKDIKVDKPKVKPEPEAEPKDGKEKPKEDEPEKVEVGGDFDKVERGGRTKTLDSRKNPSKSETFTQDIDPSDDDYPPEEQKKWQVPDPPPPFVFENDFSVGKEF